MWVLVVFVMSLICKRSYHDKFYEIHYIENEWSWGFKDLIIWNAHIQYESLMSYSKSRSFRNVGEKGRDLTQSCDKNPYTHRTIQKATWQHKNATKNFDYTTIADRLRTVSWSNSSHPTGVVKPVYERSTFPQTATAV